MFPSVFTVHHFPNIITLNTGSFFHPLSYPCLSPRLPIIFKCPTLPHLERCVAVIHGVFNKEIFENAHSQLPDLGPLLQGLGHFSQQQTDQKVVTAVFLRQAELQTLLC